MVVWAARGTRSKTGTPLTVQADVTRGGADVAVLAGHAELSLNSSTYRSTLLA
jgi:hypothetical protein